jgi:hypothetical protein
MSELLQEFVDSGSQQLRVDRELGVIRGVKLLGLSSRNGRRYRETALAEAASLYEGSKVNVNHPKGHPLSPRDYQDRLGVIRGVQLRPGEGLFGDLHFNPKHGLSEQLMWDAEHASQNVGLSHNVLARTSRRGDETEVEAITKVQSIDLVADPATTRGLFEQTEPCARAGSSSTPAGAVDRPAHEVLEVRSGKWDQLTLEQLQLLRPDLMQEIEEAQEAQLQDVRGHLDLLAAREAAAQRRERISQLLLEHELPLPQSKDESARRIVSDHFLQTLMTASTDDAVRRLVEERAALVHSARDWRGGNGHGGRRPVSRDQTALVFGVGGNRVHTAEEFAAAIRTR